MRKVSRVAPRAFLNTNQFRQIETCIDQYPWRPEFSVTEIPAPPRIAPYSHALETLVNGGDDDIASGRLIVLHDPHGNDAWHGDYRLVTYIQCDIDPEIGEDPLLPHVGWSWFTEALERAGADYGAESGTVTAQNSVGFGALADDNTRAEIEVRASWTPHLTHPGDITDHVRAWETLVCLCAGLPPIGEGITAITARRGSV